MSKTLWFGYFCAFLLVFMCALAEIYPKNAIYFIARVWIGVLGVLGMPAALVGIFTNRYDALLTSEGLKYGNFREVNTYRWSEIRAVYVVGNVARKRVWLEVNNREAKKTVLKGLPDNYGMEAAELAKMILEWQRKYRGPALN